MWTFKNNLVIWRGYNTKAQTFEPQQWFRPWADMADTCLQDSVWAMYDLELEPKWLTCLLHMVSLSKNLSFMKILQRLWEIWSGHENVTEADRRTDWSLIPESLGKKDCVLLTYTPCGWISNAYCIRFVKVVCSKNLYHSTLVGGQINSWTTSRD